ncbi:hypothetical protein CMT52_12960 [Elizabethkingia anophelis]|nr:hypothetical protein [Elizabethkingia anophelis]
MSFMKIKKIRTNEMRIEETEEGFYIQRKYIKKKTLFGFVLNVSEEWYYQRTWKDVENPSGIFGSMRAFTELVNARTEMERLRYLPKIHN